MRKGLFISFEGGEGAGKTTAIQMAAKYLQGRGIRTCTTREPGGSDTAEQIRALLLDPDHADLVPVAELLLMFASRAQNIADTIRPAIEQGTWVLCDRFTDASRAYQGAGRGIASAHIEYLAQWIHGDLNPDLTFLLDLDVSVGMARISQRGHSDRMERAEIEFYHRVRTAYRELAANNPRFLAIDAQLDIHAVQEKVIARLDQLIAATP